MKGRALFTALFLSISGALFSQTDSSEVASIYITSWSNQSQDFKVDIESFNERLVEVLTELDFVYRKANNNPPPEAMAPDENNLALYITIRLKEDKANDKKFFMPASYELSYWNVALDTLPTEFLNYFQELEVDELKRLLKR
jgi:hypothetical protein